jgi:Ca2+-binding RTX toxin-like protein
VGLSAVPAQAAVQTSTGVRCTIAGTPGDDVLYGTEHRDVICGRGGFDVIYGRGGNDLIDSGSGGGWLVGGRGNDRMLGGAGLEDMFGGPGDDHLSGGGYRDDLHGGRGKDRLSGNGGGDYIFGGSGADTLSGGDGDDTLDGGRSRDHLLGQSGDDNLSGGRGVDALDGGTGENICAVDRADTSVHCYYDEDLAPPVVVETRMTPLAVDVTDASARVTVMVHASDDTGVYFVQVILRTDDDLVQLQGSAPELVSGNLHDGWWRLTVDIGRGTRAGVMHPSIYVTDNLRRRTSVESPPVNVTVTDANPDTEEPRLTLLSPLGASAVDVRSKSADVTVSVHGTDNLSGIDRLDLCLTRLDGLDYVPVVCAGAVSRAGDTDLDGVWTAVLQIPKGAAGGDWNVMAYVTDHAGATGATFVGRDAYQRYLDNPNTTAHIVPFPDGAGRLTVMGS